MNTDTETNTKEDTQSLVLIFQDVANSGQGFRDLYEKCSHLERNKKVVKKMFMDWKRKNFKKPKLKRGRKPGSKPKLGLVVREKPLVPDTRIEKVLLAKIGVKHSLLMSKQLAGSSVGSDEAVSALRAINNMYDVVLKVIE